MFTPRNLRWSLSLMLFFLWTVVPVHAAVMEGPVLNQAERGWRDFGLIIRAETDVTLVSVRFPNQGLADEVKLLRNSDSALLASVPVAAGNRNAIVNINYPLAAQEVYRLVATTMNNKYFGSLGVIKFPAADSDITVLGSYLGSSPYYGYWFSFNDIATEPSVVELEAVIDIKPGTEVNSINLKSKGVVPVAILTTEDFDALDVDPASVIFAGAAPVRWHIEDVDGDGDNDILFQFKTEDLSDLTASSTDAVLTGSTLDGIDFSGADTVNIIPGK